MTRKKLTIGDNSGLNREGERCKVVRCLDGIEVGEVVSIRFKDEFETTPWRLYRLEEKHFPSKYDEDRRRHRQRRDRRGPPEAGLLQRSTW